MKLKNPLCPECNEPAVGTLDHIEYVVAEFDRLGNEKGVLYSGNSNVDWDSQTTYTASNGDSQVVCGKGHTWFTKITGRK